MRRSNDPARTRRVLVIGQAAGALAAAGALDAAGTARAVFDCPPPGAGPPSPGGYCGVVVVGDGRTLDASWVTSLCTWVGSGGALLALGAPSPDAPAAWRDLLGADATGRHPAGEWFAKVAPGAPHLAVRAPAEIPVGGPLETLAPRPGTTPVIHVSVGFQDAVAVAHRRVGKGSVTVSGLGTGSGAPASPDLSLILGRALRGPARPEEPIGVAVAGYGPYGGMGRYHGLAAEATPGLELVASCDPDPGRRKAAEEDFPNSRAYASVDELCADPAVSVVVVASPPSSHGGIAMALLRAGKHVVCEKPLCFTLAEADALFAAAEQQGVVLTVHQNRRWDRDFRTVRKVVAAGLLGELFNMETFVGGFEHPCRAWHSEESISGGAAYDWGAHHLDWALELIGGWPVTVSAHGHKRVWHDVTNLDQVRVRLAWEDGREAEFVHSDVAAIRRPKFYLQGTEGTLVGHYRTVTVEKIDAGQGYVAEKAHHAEAPAELILARYHSGAGLSETRLPLVDGERFAFHRNLADHLHRGEPLAVTPQAARRVVSLLEAATASAGDGGRPVVLPRL